MPRLTTLDRSIAGRVALVTGAASGMGRATAHLFADEGARVAVTDVVEDGVRKVVEEINGAGGEARGWTLDVSDGERGRVVVREVIAHFGTLQILVNNAGISRMAPIDADDYEQSWARTLEVNLSGQMRLIRAALPELMRDGAGRIVNIASTEGKGATPGNSPYSAAKHGVIGLTRSLAVELGKEGITVNAICPGPINTAMTQGIPTEQKAIYARRRTALRRYGEPEEVAHGTLSLVLPAASFITGVALEVDGGLTIRRA